MFSAKKIIKKRRAFF